MQLIGQTNIDFLGRRHIFIALSLVLLLAGAAISGGPCGPWQRIPGRASSPPGKALSTVP